MTSFSVESILFKDMYSNNNNTISNTKITKSLDDCVYDAYKSSEDLKFYETYTMINDYNNTQKLRMLNKLRYATNNIKNKQAHNSCESYIRSLEEEIKRSVIMTKNNVKSMQFKYVKPTTKSKIATVMKKYGISSLPKDLINLIINNNGGQPVKTTFDSEKTKELVFMRLLSYNNEDKENIHIGFDAIQEINPNLSSVLYPIAIEAFGDLICLDLHSKKIVHLNHETGTTEFVANSITDLISKLY